MIEISTKMQVKTTPAIAFDSFVNPEKIGNFWFSTSSAPWTKGADVLLTYKEFKAEVPIHIEDIRENEKITLTWGPTSDPRAVTLSFKEEAEGALVTASEVGFQEYEDLLSKPELSEILSYEYEDILSSLMGGQAGWTFVLSCLKAYLEHGVTDLRTGLVIR